MMTNKATKLIHLTYDGNFQLDTNANIITCRVINDSPLSNGGNSKPCSNGASGENEGDKPNVVPIELQLDVTTMHPQGGGQPTDIGTITPLLDTENGDSSPLSAKIDKVTIDRATGIVTHAGTITFQQSSNNSTNDETPTPESIFPPNTPVKVSVDPDQRLVLSECHTAGHVVDAAMAKCEKLMPPTKGYHFMDGPYVEYKGSIDVKEREEFLEKLKGAYQELIDEDIPTEIQTLSVDEAESLCNRVAQNFNMSDFASPSDLESGESKNDDDSLCVRVVTVAGWSCPCGGTHVRSTGALKQRGWSVKGLRCKKGVVRVRYGPADE